MNDDVQNIKERIDILALVQEYVELKPAGKYHKGLCPFHSEKTPSFTVSPERERWHCFGCSKGGDIFTFLQEIEGMDFVEALKHLAIKAGVTLSNTRSSVNASQKNRVKDILLEAARFYHYMLVKMDASKDAREYLDKRGLTEETIALWKIGFVPDQWDLLTKYLVKKGFSVEDLVVAGVTIKRDNANSTTSKGFYDRFRGRIMFPISNEHGNIVGFTGRVLQETEKSGGKYVNTPQTIVYDKSRVVFGLEKAKQAIREKKQAIVVEGQMDVIAAHQYGTNYVVATSGTALTEQQLTLLKRYTDTIAFAFDGDGAGIKAAERGIDLAVSLGLHVNIIVIPNECGSDPDDCIKNNPAQWDKSIEQPVDVMSWYIETAFAGKSLDKPREKQEIANRILPKVALLPFAIEQDHWLQEVSKRLGVDNSILREDMKRLEASSRLPIQKKEVESEQQETEVELPHVQLLAQLWAIGVSHSSCLQEVLQLNKALFIGSPYEGLYESLKVSYTQGQQINDNVHFQLSENDQNTFDILLMKGELDFATLTDTQKKEECQRLIQVYIKAWKSYRVAQLKRALAHAEAKQESADVNAIMKEISDIMTLGLV